MIGPDEVRARAERWWAQVLRAELTGEAVFPRDVPRIGKLTNRTSLADFDRINAQQRALVAAAPGKFTLHWREVATRSLGTNRFIDRICVDNTQQYLRLTAALRAFRTFQELVARTRVRCPDLEQWLRDKPERPLEYAGVWTDLLRVVHYFRTEHERDKYYIRELPVAVPTKFIENHRAILAELLDAVLPPDRIDGAQRGVAGFEARYGLRTRAPLVRLRVLDRALADDWFSGVDDVSLPLPQFQTLHLRPRRMILLENKTSYGSVMNFLTLPQCAGTLALFGSGFAAGQLQSIDWLREVELLYWGDLDAAGLQIVNRLRAHFPHLRTFLMDRATLNALPEYHVTCPPLPAARLEHLTERELALYDYLNGRGLRLEQERVPLAMVRAAIGRLTN